MQSYKDALIKNNNKAWILDYSCLRPASDNQGSHDLLHPQTNEVINRANITPTPISKLIMR